MSLSPTVTAIVTRMPAEAPASTATMASQATQREDQVAGRSQEEVPQRVETSAAIGELVDALKTTTIGLRFEIDEATHRVITKVIDKESGELIRQMPTEEVLRIARAIDRLQGLFINQAA
ncbi:flagellar protein FlaG [Cupriavidus taiwanensis]|uniref:flagellar protein FlaG n=1 Tax=Cupriavidus taiwanensis TaxID=164546 RepID=UPI000E10B774|nr:flagellar protein FlaG [Cupriavidus taiwanensis]SPA54948.1 Flagellar protein FlaG [Cupriavidus taiwanensis]